MLCHKKRNVLLTKHTVHGKKTCHLFSSRPLPRGRPLCSHRDHKPQCSRAIIGKDSVQVLLQASFLSNFRGAIPVSSRVTIHQLKSAGKSHSSAVHLEQADAQMESTLHGGSQIHKLINHDHLNAPLAGVGGFEALSSPGNVQVSGSVMQYAGYHYY